LRLAAKLLNRDEARRIAANVAKLPAPGLAQIEGRGSGGNPNPMEAHGQSDHAMHAHGAVFAEVKVDPDLGQMRATRVVGAFAAGTAIRNEPGNLCLRETAWWG
jgi:xanthine dehydrogenase YagR molybdenum-binding subunit